MKKISITLFALLLAGCASTPEEKYEEKPVEDLNQKAVEYLNKGENKKAATAYEEVIRQHPYSKLATRAQLMAGYAYFKAQEYEDALASVNTFLQMHPGNPEAPYAYYLKGLCYYIQVSSVDRDQDMTENAMNTFTELLKRYPNSKYARDAKLKIDLLNEYLAGRDMEVGRLYQSQGSLMAALNRFRNVVTTFETTSHLPEALYRLVEVYLSLGITKEAQASAATLGHNYPNTDWYQKAYSLLQQKDLLKTGADVPPLVKTWAVGTPKPLSADASAPTA